MYVIVLWIARVCGLLLDLMRQRRVPVCGWLLHGECDSVLQIMIFDRLDMFAMPRMAFRIFCGMRGCGRPERNASWLVSRRLKRGMCRDAVRCANVHDHNAMTLAVPERRSFGVHATCVTHKFIILSAMTCKPQSSTPALSEISVISSTLIRDVI